jgi:hypothetical protein
MKGKGSAVIRIPAGKIGVRTYACRVLPSGTKVVFEILAKYFVFRVTGGLMEQFLENTRSEAMDK